MGVALGVPTALYLLVAGSSKPKGNFVEAAKLTQLQVGKPQEVTFERTRVDGWRTFQEKPQCTHLGCAYHWEEPRNQFVCPCHESRFSIDGKVLGGPAARPLDRYPVRVENSRLLIGSEVRKA